MLLKYESNTVYAVIADKDDEPWFNGKDCAKFFGYANIKKALRNNVSTENKNKLKYIVSAYKLLYKNVQGNSTYVNENGFFELLSKSNKQDAKEIQKWMYTEVLPQLRKNGQLYLRCGRNVLIIVLFCGFFNLLFCFFCYFSVVIQNKHYVFV